MVVGVVDRLRHRHRPRHAHPVDGGDLPGWEVGVLGQDPRTPATAAGLANHIWTCEEIAAQLD